MMINAKQLYNMTGEQVMALDDGVLYRESINKNNSLITRTLKKVNNSLLIIEEGEKDFYYTHDDNNYKLTYKHQCDYDFNNFDKVENYDYRWEAYDDDGQLREEDDEKFFNGSVNLDYDRDNLYSYQNEEDVENINDMWEIIRDEFISYYYDEYNLSLYDEELDNMAWDNGL